MWLRTAAVSDVGRVDGADQAFHRDHPVSMSTTYGKLVDLAERRVVFETLFSGPGSRLRQATELQRTARSTLADEALADACRAYDRGLTESVNVQELHRLRVGHVPRSATIATLAGPAAKEAGRRSPSAYPTFLHRNDRLPAAPMGDVLSEMAANGSVVKIRGRLHPSSTA